MAGRPLAALVAAANDGDSDAWSELVDRFAALVWSVARSHRLNPSDAADVSQTVWLRLVEHLGRLREPDALPGWIATTTRNECLRTLRRAGRELPDEQLAGGAPEGRHQRADDAPGPEAVVVQAERRTLVWEALSQLSSRCQLLLRALATTSEPSYAEVSAALGMPIGSIGPTRARCLDHLRRRLHEPAALAGD